MSEFTKNFGNTGEIMARKFLEKQGVKILATNFHARSGEVDIIAQDDELILFVEVKARRSQKFGTAIESVDDKKIAKIVAAGEQWLLKNSLAQTDWRVDVITIDNGELRLIKGI